MIKHADQTLSNTTSTESPLPDLNWAEVMAEARLRRYYLSLPNLEIDRAEKWIGLKSFGYSDVECEELCRPRPIDRDEVMRGVRELAREERRKLKQWNRSKDVTLSSERNPDLAAMECLLDSAKLK
jgi:hypothetical protein